MAAPKGNKFAEGHDGSNAGRGGAGLEAIRARFAEQFLDQLLNNELEPEKIVERIKGGKFFLGESILYRAVVLGRDEILMVLMNKLFGDNRAAKPLFDQPLSEQEKVELFDAMDRAFDEFPALGYKPHRRLTNGEHTTTPAPVKRSRVRKQRNAV